MRVTVRFFRVNASASGGGVDCDSLANCQVILNLQQAVQDEATARTQGDQANADAINAEATARAQADTGLQTNIDNEATARQQGDQTNAQAITAEATARAQGDSTNDTNLTNHINNTSNPHGTTKLQVGLSNVDNVQQMPLSYLDTNSKLASNSDSKVASQKAVKKYIDLATVGGRLFLTYN